MGQLADHQVFDTAQPLAAQLWRAVWVQIPADAQPPGRLVQQPPTQHVQTIQLHDVVSAGKGSMLVLCLFVFGCCGGTDLLFFSMIFLVLLDRHVTSCHDSRGIVFTNILYSFAFVIMIAWKGLRSI